MRRGANITRRLVAMSVLAAASTIVTAAQQVSAGNETIPYYEQILPECPRQMGVPDDPCHTPGEPDAPAIIIVKCDAVRGVTNFCYEATVDGKPAPAELKILGLMTAYKLHDTSNRDAQLEANIIAYHVPAGATLAKQEIWGWGKRPADQTNGGGGKVDLSPVLTENSVLKVVLRYKTFRMPQYSVLVASGGTMDFALNGTDLTLTVEGKPARVAIETAAQHIDYDTEKSDDTSKLWPDRCGIPSMRFVVCNVDRAESNPLLFYARSSSFANAPGADVPGPIWASTNATYFHQPSVSTDPKGNKQIQVKVAAPHLLADGTTVNSGAFRAFLPNGILTQWGIAKTETALNNALAASVKKNGVETVIDRTFTIAENGVTLTFPNLTYSSPEVLITSVANTGGSQNANQRYQALLAGTIGSTTDDPTTTKVSTTTKTVRAGSKTILTKLITVAKGHLATWSVKGTGCRISSGRLVATTKGKTCTLTSRQKNNKTKKTTSSSVTVKVT